MSFINPEYSWLFLFILAFYFKNGFKLRGLKIYGYLVTFVFITLALMRPVIEQEPIQSQKLLSDVVIGVDLSYSMHAEDISPSRLEAAKAYLEKLVRYDLSSRYGVVGFTSNAIILSPLTEDSELLLHLFHGLNETLIMTKSSAIMPVLELARKLSSSKTVSLVLFTDGADETSYGEELAFAKKNNIIVNVMMLASREGATLTLANGELLKDEFDNIVVSRENSNSKYLAEHSGGVYSKNFTDIVNALESQEERIHKTDVTLVQNKELFYYFVLLAIVSFLFVTTSLKRYILVFFLLFGISLEADILAFIKNENRVAFDKGVALYQEGEYEKALVAFEKVDSPSQRVKSVVYFNEANTLVRLREFAKAREAFRKSLALHYTQEADENLAYILDVAEEKTMSTGQQKSKKKSDLAKQRAHSKKDKKKSAGSSNMKVSAQSGGDTQAKKSKQAGQISLDSSKAKLSSKQYELINKRGVHEKKPW